jgi:putative flavoprotein involved in K+ transport
MGQEGALVIGAGAAGLATAAMLKRAGVETAVLERSESIGTSWLARYDRLRLNTLRWMSDLPGYACDRRYGSFPGARDWAAYLERYAEHHALEVRFGVSVRRIELGALEWKLDTSAGTLAAPAVVVATGYDREPKLPDWPGIDDFAAELSHAADYRNAAPYSGRSVLVVGAGNSGSEIAGDLAEGGAAKVWLAVRTPPNVFPRRWLGVPINPLGVLLDVLPTPLADRAGWIGQQMIYGDLSRYGLPRSPIGVKTRVRRDAIAACVDGGFVAAVKRGRIEVVAAVRALDGREVVLDGGRRLEPDAVIAATGYRRGLEPLVGHLGVLQEDGRPVVHGERTHPNAPGLYFIGFDTLSSGQLRLFSRDAKAIARRVAYGRRSLPMPGRASAGSGAAALRPLGTPRTRPA